MGCRDESQVLRTPSCAENTPGQKAQALPLPLRWQVPSSVPVLPVSAGANIQSCTCLLGLPFRPWNNFLKTPYTNIKTK